MIGSKSSTLDNLLIESSLGFSLEFLGCLSFSGFGCSFALLDDDGFRKEVILIKNHLSKSLGLC